MHGKRGFARTAMMERNKAIVKFVRMPFGEFYICNCRFFAEALRTKSRIYDLELTLDTVFRITKYKTTTAAEVTIPQRSPVRKLVKFLKT